MGARGAKRLRIFLGNQPRLLREMLEFALKQMIDNAEIQQIEVKSVAGIDVSALSAKVNSWDTEEGETSTLPWIVLTVQSLDSPQADTPDQQAVALLNQHPRMQIAMLGYDASTLQTYTPHAEGDVQHKTYTDFSLSEFVEIFQRRA